jgi:hypothetical protein
MFRFADPLPDYLNNLRLIHAQLSTTEYKISDKQLVFQALQGLPNHYGTIVRILTADEAKVKWETVSIELMKEEMRIREEDSKDDVVLRMYQAKDKNRNGQRSKEPMECWNCGKFGHMKRDCRSKPKTQGTSWNTSFAEKSCSTALRLN